MADMDRMNVRLQLWQIEGKSVSTFWSFYGPMIRLCHQGNLVAETAMKLLYTNFPAQEVDTLLRYVPLGGDKMRQMLQEVVRADISYLKFVKHRQLIYAEDYRLWYLDISLRYAYRCKPEREDWSYLAEYVPNRLMEILWEQTDLENLILVQACEGDDEDVIEQLIEQLTGDDMHDDWIMQMIDLVQARAAAADPEHVLRDSYNRVVHFNEREDSVW